MGTCSNYQDLLTSQLYPGGWAPSRHQFLASACVIALRQVNMFQFNVEYFNVGGGRIVLI